MTEFDSSKDQKEARRKERERREIILAQQSGKSRSYVDDDGCEVTVTPTGHAFYNAADWF